MKTKKFEDPTLSLYKIDVNNGVPTEEVDDWNRLPLIIGLDYEQFLRTVLIDRLQTSLLPRKTSAMNCSKSSSGVRNCTQT